jgi:predicted transposase/invertase (TIGR01784 family)
MAKVTKSETASKSKATLHPSIQKAIINQEPVGRYIDPLTDFGFKHIFGTKEYLMDFLNAVLDIEGEIIDLQYDNTERTGRSKDDRTTYFDLYCTLATGESIILEMQYNHQEFFKDRTLYYASRLIQEQGEDQKGNKRWGYELKPVFSVNIVNFALGASVYTVKAIDPPVDKYVSYVQLFDRDTLKVFYKKLTFIFLELPYFTRELDELLTPMDWWMYVLKNLAKLDRLPDALRNNIFESLFSKAEIAKLSKKDRKEYDHSLKKNYDMNTIIADRDKRIAELERLYGVDSKQKSSYN